MSKLYIKDLKSIVNGKIVRFHLGTKASSLVSLSRIDKERTESRNIRERIVEQFKNDLQEEFERRRNGKIEDTSITLYPERLFFKDYLSLFITTMLGDTYCLLSKDSLVTSSSTTPDLEEKVEIILPYVKRLLELRKYTKLLENDFFEDINIYNEMNEKVLILNGGGVFLPFGEYQDLGEYDLQELLSYYYSNWDILLKNILISNEDILNRYKKDIEKEKALKIYKGAK